jgi:hypothetical protein
VPEAEQVDGGKVALLGIAAHRLQGAVALPQPVQPVANVRLGGLVRGLVNLDALVLGELHLGAYIDCGGEYQRLVLGELGYLNVG